MTNNITIIKRKVGNTKSINNDLFKKVNSQIKKVKKNGALFKKYTLKNLSQTDNSSRITIINTNQNLNTIEKKCVHAPINIVPPKINTTDNTLQSKYKSILDCQNKKKILIYQNNNMHTEVIGMLMYNFKNYEIDIYYPHINDSSNSIPYYEEIFKKKARYVNAVFEDLYNIVIILTSREISTAKPKCSKKYIAINHENESVNSSYFNISLTPIVKSNYYILPIYEYPNNCNRENQICIIGSMYSHQRDLDNIHKLIKEYPMYKICLFTRLINDNIKNTFTKYKNFVLYEKSDTKSMINIIRKSKFIYTADTENYTETGVRGGILTGMIPLGLNNNVPIIMTKRLNVIYGLTGILLYDKDITELKGDLINLNDLVYSDLIKKSKNDVKKFCLGNDIKWDIIKKKFSE